jgi:hypothetical protein
MEILLWCESHTIVTRTVALLSAYTKTPLRVFFMRATFEVVQTYYIENDIKVMIPDLLNSNT